MRDGKARDGKAVESFVDSVLRQAGENPQNPQVVSKTPCRLGDYLYGGGQAVQFEVSTFVDQPLDGLDSKLIGHVACKTSLSGVAMLQCEGQREYMRDRIPHVMFFDKESLCWFSLPIDLVGFKYDLQDEWRFEEKNTFSVILRREGR